MAVLALTLAGQAAGAAIGGSILGVSAATIGGTIGMVVGNVLFNKPPDQRGPKLSSLETSTAADGTAIPIMWGTMRVAGQVCWAPKLTRKVRRTSVGGKGGGATASSEYATGSWYVSFGYNRDGVPRTLRRAWANKKLIYDATGSGAVIEDGISFTYYDGTQTTPDPTMEGIIGEGNVSAHTGQAGMVFDDQNLEEWGNHIPSIEAELVENGSSTTDLTDINLADRGYVGVSTGPGYMWFDSVRQLLWVSIVGGSSSNYGALFAINPHTQKVIWQRLNSDTAGNNSGYMALTNYEKLADRVAFARGGFVEVYDTTTFASLGTYSVSFPAYVWPMFRGVLYEKGGGNLGYWRGDIDTDATITVPSGYGAGNHAAATKTWALGVLGERDPTDDVSHVFIPTDGGNHGYFRLSLPHVASTPTLTAVVSAYASTVAPVDGITGLALPNGSFVSGGVYTDVTDSYWFPFSPVGGTDDFLVEIDPTSGSVVGFYDLSSRLDGYVGSFNWGASSGHPYITYDSAARRLWFTSNAYLCWFDAASKKGGVYSGTPVDSPVFYHRDSGVAFGQQWNDVPAPSYDRIWIMSVDNVAQASVAVASVIRDCCVRAGIPASTVVFSNVDTYVTGVIANQHTSAKDMVNPLLQYAYADGYESEYKLKFVARGAAVATTLSSDYINAAVPNSRPESVELTEPHSIELPKHVDLRFYNALNAHQIGDALASWHTGRSERRSVISMPLSITPDQALKRAGMLLSAMYSRQQVRLTYGPRYAKFEPTDVVNVPLNDRVERVRIDNIQRGVNGIRKVSASFDRAEDAQYYASAAVTNTRGEAIVNDSPLFPFWIDLPMLRDTDGEHPGPYIALYNYSSGFEVGELYTSLDNNAYNAVAQFDTEPLFGIVTNVPNDVASFGVFDIDSVLNVEMLGGTGTLESVSTAVLLAGGNAAAWGKPGRFELIQWLSVAVTSAGTRQFGSLLRGRRGTDNNMNNHEANDWFIVLDDESLSRLVYSVSDINRAVYTRAARAGESYADVTPSVFSVTNTALRPYSPISALYASASTGGDLLGGWTRRTRAGGSYVGFYDNVGGSLSEDSESWEIDVVNTATGSVVVSGIATTAANHAYSSASQVADGVNTLGTVTFRIFQISAAVGRGNYASVTYERPWDTGLKYAIGLGVDKYLPLSDAGTGVIKDYYGSAVGVWGASTGVSSAGVWLGALRTAPASINCDSSTSNGILGSWPRDYCNGKKQLSIAFWVSPDFSGQDVFLDIQGDLICRLNNTLVELYVYPNGGGSGWANTGATPTTAERANPLFLTYTINTSTRVIKTCFNGVVGDSDTYSAAHNSYANPISWPAYSSATPARIGSRSNGTTSPFVGRISDLQFYPTALSSAQVSTLYEKQQGYIQRVNDLGAAHLWTLDARTSKSNSTEPDRAGSSPLTYTFYSSQGKPLMKAVRYSGEFNATYHARRALTTDMRSQVFSIEAWIAPSLIAANQPFLTLWPKGAYASAKGLQLLVDSTQGIRCRYGNGDGVFRYIQSSTAVAMVASAPYHVVVTKSSTTAPTLFVNGSAVSVGASVFDIDWSDAAGSYAPSVGTIYVNMANQSTVGAVAPDTNGVKCRMNMVAVYPTALSSAQVLANYKLGQKLL